MRQTTTCYRRPLFSPHDSHPATPGRLRCLFVASMVLLAACGGQSGTGGAEDTITLGPFRYSATLANPASPYADVLGRCVYRSTLPVDEICPLTRLPLIAQVTPAPTVDDVMDRVLVTDAWMATRLREVLENLPPETMDLFGSLTAIVIARDIRPAFFTCYTGALYLDADYLWVTAEERATVSTVPDYRTAFGKDLPFYTRARYTRDDAYAWSSAAPRTVEDITGALGSLLFHELAHANDRFPPASVASLPRNLSCVDACRALAGQRGSDRLCQATPLRSQRLFRLAQVFFGGVKSTRAQRALTPDAVAAELVQEGASDDYAYYTQFEDFAMLFEETMTKFTLGVERDFAVTTQPGGEAPDLNAYVVAWGQRNRIADPLVRPRARLVVQQILPASQQQAVLDFLEDLPPPVAMVPGRGWLDNLDLGSDGYRSGRRTAGIPAEPFEAVRGGDLVLPPE